jgi:hypothetical protein
MYNNFLKFKEYHEASTIYKSQAGWEPIWFRMIILAPEEQNLCSIMILWACGAPEERHLYIFSKF